MSFVERIGMLPKGSISRVPDPQIPLISCLRGSKMAYFEHLLDPYFVVSLVETPHFDGPKPGISRSRVLRSRDPEISSLRDPGLQPPDPQDPGVQPP